MVYTEYHSNGIIKRKARFMGSAMFGKDEYFDERGKLVKSVDEDAKFGKIKPQDIPGIIEKIGLFNTETGENIFTREPLPTDGLFTSRMSGKLDIRFIPAGIDPAGNPHSGSWMIIYYTRNSRIIYSIDGETGEYEFDEQDWFRLD